MRGQFGLPAFASESDKVACNKYCDCGSFDIFLRQHMHYQSPFLRARQLLYCQVFVCMAVSVELSSPRVFPIGTTLGGTICYKRIQLTKTHSSWFWQWQHSQTLQFTKRCLDNAAKLRKESNPSHVAAC